MIELQKHLTLDSETDIVKQRTTYCNICWGNDNQNKKIIICRNCNTHVHEDCYYTQEQKNQNTEQSNWLCQKCEYIERNRLQDKSEEIQCCFCTNDQGILKIVKIHSQKRWVHPACVELIPEISYIDELKDKVTINNPQQLQARRKIRCKFCKVEMALQCSHGKCLFSFHPHCAQQQNLLYKMEIMKYLFTNKKNKEQFQLYCPNHIYQHIEEGLSQRRQKGEYLSLDLEREMQENFISYWKQRYEPKEKKEKRIVQKKVRKAIEKYYYGDYLYQTPQKLRKTQSFQDSNLQQGSEIQVPKLDFSSQTKRLQRASSFSESPSQQLVFQNQNQNQKGEGVLKRRFSEILDLEQFKNRRGRRPKEYYELLEKQKGVLQESTVQGNQLQIFPSLSQKRVKDSAQSLSSSPCLSQQEMSSLLNWDEEQAKQQKNQESGGQKQQVLSRVQFMHSQFQKNYHNRNRQLKMLSQSEENQKEGEDAKSETEEEEYDSEESEESEESQVPKQQTHTNSVISEQSESEEQDSESEYEFEKEGQENKQNSEEIDEDPENLKEEQNQKGFQHFDQVDEDIVLRNVLNGEQLDRLDQFDLIIPEYQIQNHENGCPPQNLQNHFYYENNSLNNNNLNTNNYNNSDINVHVDEWFT